MNAWVALEINSCALSAAENTTDHDCEGNKIQIKYFETMCLDCPANISLVKCKASVPLICYSLVSKSRNRWGFGVTDQEAPASERVSWRSLHVHIGQGQWRIIEIFPELPAVRLNNKRMANELCGYLLNVCFYTANYGCDPQSYISWK